jgi:hypothetical protein
VEARSGIQSESEAEDDVAHRLRLSLTDAEVHALARALDSYLPELAEEASRTERHGDAAELWHRYGELQVVRARLPLEP